MANFLTPQEMANVIGTWHPRGYHGHERAKSRIELSQYYRQVAKPPPPTKFRSRQTESALKHSFSHHDNRQAFLNDPLLFGSGLGKKKVESVNKSNWNPEFIAWSEDAGKDRFRRSIYQHDFCLYPNNNKLLSARKPSRDVSVYAYNYNHGEPGRQASIDTQREIYYRFLEKNISQVSRAKSCGPERASVASCLVWNDRIKREPTNIQASNTTQTVVTAPNAPPSTDVDNQ